MQEKSARIYLFDKHIATLYDDKGRIYLKQVDGGAHFASPISIDKDIAEIETTRLPEGVAGFIHDALPGDYGDTVMEAFYLKHEGREPRILDKLLFIGDRSLGALSFKPEAQRDDTEHTLQLRELFDESKKIQEGIVSATSDYLMIAAHSVAGGARSKAVVGVDLESKQIYLGHRHGKLPDGFMRAIIKYDDTPEQKHSEYTKLEYLYSLLAKEADIPMSQTYLMEDNGRLHFVTKRFDHIDTKRYHIHSLAGLLHSDYKIPRSLDYDDLFRAANALGTRKDIPQLFRQMIFNYMFVNQDDHSKNFSFMMDKNGEWSVTPAYDLTFAKGKKMTVEHQLKLDGKNMSAATLDDVVAIAKRHGVSMELLANMIDKMNDLRKTMLPELLKEYAIGDEKKKFLLSNVQKRTFGGAL